MKKAQVVRTYYVLPCCLLLLNLGNNLVSYKAGVIKDPYLKVLAIIGLVLIGGSVITLALSPALETGVRALHRGSRNSAGWLGEICFLVLLGLLIFYAYYLYYIYGPEALLPRDLWNPDAKPA